MMSQFENDLRRFYTLLGERQQELGNYYSIVEKSDYDKNIEAAREK